MFKGFMNFKTADEGCGVILSSSSAEATGTVESDISTLFR